MEWMDPDFEVPPIETRRPAVNCAKLREQRGRWAVISRYPSDKVGSARARGSTLCKRQPDIEYAVRRIGDECVLYMRALPQDEEEAG